MRSLNIIFAVVLFVFFACENADKKDKEMEEAQKEIADNRAKNKEKEARKIIGDLARAWTNNDKDLMNSIMAEDVVRYVNGQKESSTREQYISNVDSFHNAFSNIKVELSKEPVVMGDITFNRFSFSGNNTGNFMGNPPTDKSIRIHGLSIWSLNDKGKAIKEEVYYDNHAILNQLGYNTSAPEKKK
jgi:steroid delta-isomerase-like uncharacterized protein